MSYRVAIVGATGAVGAELLSVLEQRRFPISELVCLASERSIGKSVSFCGRDVSVRALNAQAFSGADFALFSAGASRSREFAPIAVGAGAVVIDNSSAFRMDKNIPLVVPEINSAAMKAHKGIIANPNCAAIILAMGLQPLRKLGRIVRVVVSTYQSTSGAGARAMEELLEQTRGYLDGAEPPPEVFAHPIAFNLFSHNAAIEENGYNGEENKVVLELQKIMADEQMRVSATCVRVPTLRAHCESVNVEFDRPVSAAAARACYEGFPGVSLCDDRVGNTFPMPRTASGKDDVSVGRLREDLSHPCGLNLFLAGDQLRKGAALNAIQIAEALISAS